MLYKTKFCFRDSKGTPVKVPTVPFEKLKTSNFYIPDDIKKLIKGEYKVFLGRDRFDYNISELALRLEQGKAITILDGLDKDVEFALLDITGCKYYRALNVAFPCVQLNEIVEMQLLVEAKTSEEQFHGAVTEIFNFYKARTFDVECGEFIAYAVEVLKDSYLFEEYANEQLSKISTADGKIELLLRMNMTFEKSTMWRTCFMKLAEDLYLENVKEVRLDNMIYKNTILSPLIKTMGMSMLDYITSFSQDIVVKEEPTLVFQALSSAGFKAELILGIVNVVELYMRAVLDGEEIVNDGEFASRFKVLQTNFNKLNTMLGIENLFDYTLREDYSINEFFNAYKTFIEKYNELEKYRKYAEKEFEIIKRYKAIYDPIHELLSIEMTASSHPENITKEYINEHISRGRYKNAICDLHVKLQFDLRKILKADDRTHANDLIDRAKEGGIIDEKESSSLHKLRICRNRLQHPNKVEVQFNQTDIENWRDIVFSIGGNK